MLTENQVKIINLLHNEFDRMNESYKSSSSFNLIDINALNKKTLEINKFRDEVFQINKSWGEAATSEAYKIMDALKADLPDVLIVKDGKENHKIESPKINIIHPRLTYTAHFEDCVSIEVKVITKTIKDNYGNYYSVGDAIGYETYPTALGRKDYYCDVKAAMKDSRFLEALRNRVIDRV